jgi:ubiquinone/menaquinone biosynthesis C-methylase UbiE
MILEQLRIHKNIPDEQFDAIYPFEIRELSDRHWTSVYVAKLSAGYLCNQKPVKVLDIGSGVGKFCLVGAILHPRSEFHGVDIRQNFIDISNAIKNEHAVSNVHFFQKDVLQMNFSGYDAIYFFNSFQEKIDVTSIIDRNSEVSVEMYMTYIKHIFNELNNVPIGTKLVTYYSEEFYVPNTFKLISTHIKGELKFYLKDMDAHEIETKLNQEEIDDHIDKHTFLNELNT